MFIPEVEAVGSARNVPLKQPELILHSETVEFPAIAVLTVDIESDYIKNWTDYILVECAFTLAMYSNIIEAASESILEGTLVNGPKGTQRFRAIIAPTKDLVNADALASIKGDALDNSLMTLSIQLVDLSAEAMSMTYVGGIYSGLTRTDLVRAAITEGNAQLEVSYPLESLEVVEGDNAADIVQVLVPSHTPVLKIANLTQKTLGGLYSGGANLYISRYKEKSRCYVYPPLKHRWEKTPASERLICWDLFETATNYRERTYDLYPEGSEQVHCIVNKQVVASEAHEARATVRSTGFRIVDPGKMMDGLYSISPKSVTSNAKRADSRVAVGSRKDGLNTHGSAESIISTNHYDAMSGVRANQGKTFRFTWTNGNPELLYPGMPIKTISEVGDKLIERYGSLIYAYSAMTRIGGIRSSTYRQVCYLVVFVDQESPTKD